MSKRQLRGRHAAVLLTAAAFVLAGCQATPAASVSTSPTATARPTKSPTPTATATATATATPSSTPSPSPSDTAVPTGTTVITVQLAGCENCTIYANQNAASGPGSQPIQVAATVRKGQATLRVPTAATNGMWFSLTCTGDICNSSNAMPVVALQYKAQAVGTSVTDTTAAAAHEASGCWVGTTDQQVSLPLTMTVFADTILGRKAHSIRVWANPQVATVDNTWLITWHGGLGTQAQLSC